jgi:putative heme-binding domain-containing protein
VGPDGAIYVADWFDARVGGHGTLDDAYTGSIYRIAPKGFKSVVPKLDLNTTEGQIAALKSPAVNVRNGGFIRLKEQGAKAVPAVAALLNDENPYIAARAIWLLAQMGGEGPKLVQKQLESQDSYRRLVALRALHRANKAWNGPEMRDDKSAAVRREVALNLRGNWGKGHTKTLTTLAKQFDGKDRAYLEALGLGCTGYESQAYDALLLSMGGPAESWSDAFAGIAWRLHPPEAVADFKTRILSPKLTLEQRKLMLTALAFVKSREAAGAMMELAHTKDFPLKDLAMWWLMNRKNNDWKAYDLEGGMKALGLYDPEKVKLVPVEMPPSPTSAPQLPEPLEIVKLKGDAARGLARVSVCYTCHKIGATGVEFGPDLTAFGKLQPAEVIITGIAKPSADISHGFEGSEVKTKDGLTITGMVLSEGDPLIIKCMGGLVQTIPKAKIESVKKMPRSLMYEPQLLGLDAQAIADIVVYLKTL